MLCRDGLLKRSRCSTICSSCRAQRYVSPYTVAAIYAGLGDQAQAFKWLETAVEERDIWLMNLKVDPVFAKLRSQRQFTDILGRIRLRP